MSHKNPTFQLYEVFYPDALLRVRGIEFTHRQIDVIACLINGETNISTGTILSIQEDNVGVHKSNIRRKIPHEFHEDIIRFTQKSPTIHLIRDHYQRLLYKFDVEKELKKLFVLSRRKQIICVIRPEIFNKERQIEKSSFIRLLCQHLELAGITISDDDTVSETNPNTWTLYNVDKDVIDKIQAKNHIFLLHNKEMDASVLKGEQINAIDFRDPKDYFSSLLTLLKTFFSDSELVNLSPLITPDHDRNSTFYNNDFGAIPLHNSSLSLTLKTFQKRKTILWGLFILACFLFVGINLFTLQNKDPLTQTKQAQISNIPEETMLLHRSDLLKEIHNKLNNQTGIGTFVLFGVGGTGKTTLAQTYVNTYATTITWEVNAETRNSLLNSFENLAQALAITEDEQKTLRELHDIKDEKKKEEVIRVFVKKHFKDANRWILIFDNVENLAEIESHLPKDQGWGQGQVILTTRDRNLENHTYCKGSLFVGELDQKQKHILFNKIFTTHKINKENQESFLKEIPPYPLDIKTAASYIKDTGISYTEYLMRMHEAGEGFEKSIENLLKGRGGYQKTRYAIIKLSLQKIIKENPLYQDFLLLISLIDSQNIPKDLFVKYKDKYVVDDFIRTLRRHSLITNETLASSSLPSTFSIHRSTQAVLLAFLHKTLPLKGREQERVGERFWEYLYDLINKGIFLHTNDFSYVKLLIRHIETFIHNPCVLQNLTLLKIKGELGYFYYILTNFSKAKSVLEELVSLMKQFSYGKDHTQVRLLSYLVLLYGGMGEYEKSEHIVQQIMHEYSNIYFIKDPVLTRALVAFSTIFAEKGDIKKAKEIIKKSLTLYEKYFSKDELGYAYILTGAGYIYFRLWDFDKSKESLQKSINIYRKYKMEKHVHASWTIAYLGFVYWALGDFFKAEELLQKTLKFQKNLYHGESIYIGWALGRLGLIYLEMKKYKNAQDYLEKSIKIYEKNLGKYNIKTQLIWYEIGKLYIAQKKLKQAKIILKEYYDFVKKHNKDNYIFLSRSLISLAYADIMEGNIKNAEQLTKKALEHFNKNKNPEIYTAFEQLSDIYVKKSENSLQSGNFSQAKAEKVQAKEYIEKAFCIISPHFPKDSPHRIRIEKKLQNLSAS